MPKDEYLKMISKDLTLTTILNMNDDFFKARIKPIMYNYISKLRMFKRNAIMAVENSGNESYIPDLELVMKSDDELIREYSGWALGKLSGVNKE